MKDLQIKVGRPADNVASSGNEACAVGAARLPVWLERVKRKSHGRGSQGRDGVVQRLQVLEVMKRTLPVCQSLHLLQNQCHFQCFGGHKDESDSDGPQ